MKFLNKDFIIKFFIVDAIFFVVFYITFIFTFPLKEIVDANKRDVSDKLGKKINYKDISLTLGLGIKVKGMEIININKDTAGKKKQDVKKEILR